MFGLRNSLGAVVVDGRHRANTAQCVHCGSHEEIKPGSGKERGFCRLCKGFLCGLKACMNDCIPFEARLDLTEAIDKKHYADVKALLARYPRIKPL